MLKDKLFNIIKGSSQIKHMEGFRGEVEIKAWKNGELFYHDGGSNTVTVWARHANIHLLSGNSFANTGNRTINVETGVVAYSKPLLTVNDHSEVTNKDGILISGKQYFWDSSEFNECIPSNPSPSDADYAFPFFPTKMLFGTGYEFTSWASMPEAFQTRLSTTFDPENGFTEAQFNNPATLTSSPNYYSNTVVDNVLSKTRTVNDVFSGSIPETGVDAKLQSVNYENQYGINGAVKSCGFTTFNAGPPKSMYNEITADTAQYIFDGDKTNAIVRGLGRPSFIYCRRGATPEYQITADSTKEYNNRITFTVVMPEQTDMSNTFYPYNGYTIKEAGLFCDGIVKRGNIQPGVGDPGWGPFNCMPQGLMFAKRKITPITKNKDIKISISWALYL